MKNFVVYHNPDSMGYPASAVFPMSIVTNKNFSDNILGSKIWLITGVGRPRKYYIAARFVAGKIERGEDEDWVTRITGHNGKRFKPIISINDCTWLRDFVRKMGNFAFGMQAITDKKIIKGLEDVSKKASKSIRGGTRK